MGFVALACEILGLTQLTVSCGVVGTQGAKFNLQFLTLLELGRLGVHLRELFLLKTVQII